VDGQFTSGWNGLYPVVGRDDRNLERRSEKICFLICLHPSNLDSRYDPIVSHNVDCPCEIAKNMKRRHFMSVLLSHSGLGAAILAATGCGTLMYPERRGQRHSNQIDWKVVALNGLGLLLFFIPGVIAFAVDFHSGAIYLPAGHGHAAHGGSPANRPQESSQTGVTLVSEFRQPAMIAPFGAPQPAIVPLGLRKIVVPREQLRLSTIEQIVSAHVGQPVLLEDDSRVSELSQIEEFDAQIRHHQSDQRFGHSLRKYLPV